MKVAILAGGLGTRLGQLTRGLPKPMIMVAGRPFLELVIDSFAARGFREFVLLTGHHGDVIEAHFGRGRRDLHFEYSREGEPLGTGGALRQAGPLLGERFLVTYGDVLRQFDYDRFVNDHPRSCLAVYEYSPEITTISAGNVAIDEGEGIVTQFIKGRPELNLPYVDAGFAVIEAAALNLLPEGESSFEEIVYPALARRLELECEIVDRDFHDIGNPADLARARAALGGPAA